MARTIYGNLTGRAARTQWLDLQDLEAVTKRSIEDELLSKLEFLQKAKTREMKWSQTRKDGKSACMFCKLAVSLHKQELSIRDQILLITSIQPEIAEAHAVSDRFNFSLIQPVEF